jgi:hypothetical protein
VAVLSGVAALEDWSIGWIYLVLGAFLAAAMLFTHYPRKRERAEREAISRSRPARDQLPPPLSDRSVASGSPA